MTGSGSRKTQFCIISADLDSIRSTVLGKFYEGIVAKWLNEKGGYQFQPGKPAVYWQNITIPVGKKYDDYRAGLKKLIKNKKKRANSDGLFKKGNGYYLWETKNWPKWDEGYSNEKEQILDIFKGTPWLFTKKVNHNGTEIPIEGVIFSWWQKFDKFKDFEKELSLLIGSQFRIYFTSEIIDDCRRNKYKWYLKLINEQEQNIATFFKELKGK